MGFLSFITFGILGRPKQADTVVPVSSYRSATRGSAPLLTVKTKGKANNPTPMASTEESRLRRRHRRGLRKLKIANRKVWVNSDDEVCYAVLDDGVVLDILDYFGQYPDDFAAVENPESIRETWTGPERIGGDLPPAESGERKLDGDATIEHAPASSTRPSSDHGSYHSTTRPSVDADDNNTRVAPAVVTHHSVFRDTSSDDTGSRYSGGGDDSRHSHPPSHHNDTSPSHSSSYSHSHSDSGSNYSASDSGSSYSDSGGGGGDSGGGGSGGGD